LCRPRQPQQLHFSFSSFAAAIDWCIYQTDIERAFFHGILDEVVLYIDPVALYPYASDQVLELWKAVCGLHQTPPTFKKEMKNGLRAQGHQVANDSKTVWISRNQENVLIHALWADDFLHFSNDKNTHARFRGQIKTRFVIPMGGVGICLGNRIVVESEKLSVNGSV
jgi:hypothetical protein